jgi:transketolase
MYIAEQNMVGVGLGLARRGRRPFVSTFAAFMTRAYDQIRMSQYSDADMVFVGSHAGVSIGEDGPSQMGLEDLAMFRAIRDSVVLYPSDAVSADRLVEAAAEQQGIVYIRTTRAKTPVIYSSDEPFAIGGSRTVRSSTGDRVTVIAAGYTLHEALAACDELARENLPIRVVDAYSVKPVDREMIERAADETGCIVVVEDHYAAGGLGEAVLSALAGRAVRFHHLAVTKKPRSGSPDAQIEYQGLDSRSIAETIRGLADR